MKDYGRKREIMKKIKPTVWLYVAVLTLGVIFTLVTKYQPQQVESTDLPEDQGLVVQVPVASVPEPVEEIPAAEAGSAVTDGVIITDSGASVSFASVGDSKAVFVSEEQIRSMQKK